MARKPATLSAYKPTLREQLAILGEKGYTALTGNEPGYEARDLINRYTGLADLLDVPGIALSASDAARSIGTRQYPQAAADVAGMALGAIPIAGPALKGAGKKVVKEGVEAAARTAEDLASKYGAEAPKTVVYHSGPKKFGQFDSSKLGKGFGSMFGLGHYTAEGEGARDFWREQIAKQGKKPHTYEIAVNANPEDFLHWQEPMSNQSETVKAAMDEISKEIAATQNAARDSLKSRGTTAFGKPLTPDKLEELNRIAESGDVTGQQIYRYFQNKFGASGPDDKGAEVAKALLEKNIPGVRYVAPTRPGMDPRLAGSKNLVIFDDKIMDILKRYGLAPIMAGAAYEASQQNSPDPNEPDITKARGGVVNSADLRYKYGIK